MTSTTYETEVLAYLNRPIAREAAGPLKDGASVELVIEGQSTILTRRQASWNLSGSPDMTFSLTATAWRELVDRAPSTIGETGIQIAQLVISQHPENKVYFKLHAGFGTLWSRGYFGVIKLGGSAFSQFLSSKGLTGMSGIRAVIAKLRTR